MIWSSSYRRHRHASRRRRATPDLGRPRTAYHRRRLTCAAGLVAVVGVIWLAVSGSAGRVRDARAEQGGSVTPVSPPRPELPRGGRPLLPDFRLVGFYGMPPYGELGELGVVTPDSAARRLAKQAKPYERERRPVLPVLELIAVLAHAAPGEDGMYRVQQSDEVIRRYLRAARRHRALLLLDIQPARASFLDEALRLRKWLKEPDVGLALDPEWRVGPAQVPGQAIGSVTARKVNAVSAWLEQLSAEHELPQKLFVIHQFTDEMVDETGLERRERLAMVLNFDGIGDEEVKKSRYVAFARSNLSPHLGVRTG